MYTTSQDKIERGLIFPPSSPLPSVLVFSSPRSTPRYARWAPRHLSTLPNIPQFQDFKDVSGDLKIGRRTLPMIFPVASRVSVLISLVGWSLGLEYLWNTGPIISGILLALASFIGSRFIFLKSVLSDQRSFYLYNVCRPTLTPFYSPRLPLTADYPDLVISHECATRLDGGLSSRTNLNRNHRDTQVSQ